MVARGHLDSGPQVTEIARVRNKIDGPRFWRPGRVPIYAAYFLGDNNNYRDLVG